VTGARRRLGGVDVEIRPCRPEELTAVLDLFREAGGPPGATDTLEALEALVEHDPGALLVAEVSGEVIGTLVAAWDGWRGNLYRLAVSPAHRRGGVARALVEAGERRLRERGARRISALVADDPEAVAFWEAAGYRRDPRALRYIKATQT
jgi:ribosomal protein S18 acetylase RimI-like enzyme